MTRPFIALVASVIGVTLVAIAGAFVMAHQTADSAGTKAANEATAQLRMTLLEACGQANVRTMEQNRRIRLHERQNESIRIVAAGARRARLAAYKRDGQAEDLRAAREYAKAMRLLDGIKFKPLALADCGSRYRPSSAR